MLRAIIRIILALAILLVMFLPFYVTYALRLHRVNIIFVRWAFYLGTVVWGIKVNTRGKLADNRPLLLISGHFSYIDVFVLGSAIKVHFTPKSDVEIWPFIGFFCKMNGCIFIDRRRSATKDNKHMLDAALQDRDIISLFPEGTTNEGLSLLPFKSSFFAIVENKDIAVQPVSVVYNKLDGKPVTTENRHIIGWYGDAEFAPHLVQFLRHRSLEATIIYHKAVKGSDFVSRKELAEYCQSVIQKPFVR